jgi:hypothetical protein
MFLSPRQTGAATAARSEHLGFVADLDATMRGLAAIGMKVIEPVKDTPGPTRRR